MKCPAHAMPSAPLKLRVVRRERWPEGDTRITFYAIPLPYRRKPIVPSRAPEKIATVPIACAYASQTTVTNHGLRKEPGGIPLVYRETDGTYTIGDGHHRFVRAMLRGKKTIRARVVTA